MIVPTVDINPPVVVKVPATMGERHYAEKLEEIERKVKDGSYGGSKTYHCFSHVESCGRALSLAVRTTMCAWVDQHR